MIMKPKSHQVAATRRPERFLGASPPPCRRRREAKTMKREVKRKKREMEATKRGERACGIVAKKRTTG